MSKIRLIASDLDGTLLLNGAQKTTDELFSLVEELDKLGIIFAAASGRQYPNLRRLFGPVSDKLLYICENGSVVIYKGELIKKTPMDKNLGREIIKCIEDVPQCEVLVSGERVSYLNPKSEAYLVRMRDIVKNDIVLVDNLYDICEDYVKISVYDPTGIDNTKEHFLGAFAGRAQANVSGVNWLDYTGIGVNKGSAIKSVCEALNISQDQCIAFGDNYNDIEMFDTVGYPVVMEKAVADVKSHAKYEAHRVEDSLAEIIRRIKDERN